MKDYILDFTKVRGKHIVLFGISLLILPFTLGVFLNIPLGKYTIGSEDSWISFNGSYIGGIIGGITGGIVAFYIAKLQIDEMRREQNRIYNDNYKKTYLKIENYFDITEPMLNGQGSLVNKMQAHRDSESNASDAKNANDRNIYMRAAGSSLEDIKKIDEEIKQFKRVLEDTPSEYIPIEIYKDFIQLIWTLEKLHTDIQEFLNNDYIYLVPHSYNPDNFDQNLNANNAVIQHRIIERNSNLFSEYWKLQEKIKSYYLVESELIVGDSLDIMINRNPMRKF